MKLSLEDLERLQAMHLKVQEERANDRLVKQTINVVKSGRVYRYCPVCDKRVYTKSAYLVHLRTLHPEIEVIT